MDYEKLICDLKDLATVYKLTRQTTTKEYRLSMQAAQAVEDLTHVHELDQSEIVRLRRQIEALQEGGTNAAAG